MEKATPSFQIDDYEDTQKDMFMTFHLGCETYGFEIEHVTEIVGFQEITPLPDLPEYIRGIINLRGKIIPVLDVRMRFNKPFREYDDRTCIIVVDVKDISAGMIVDGVSEVLSIPANDIVAPPEINAETGSKFIKGIGKVENEVKLILNCSKLLTDQEVLDLETKNVGGKEI